VSGSVRVPVRSLTEGMNKTEARRAMELEAMKRSGQIADWWYERFTFKLAHDCRYTPDFAIQERDGSLRLEEVKGHWEDDAKVKCRVMAETFPFPLRALLWDRISNSWKIEVFR